MDHISLARLSDCVFVTPCEGELVANIKWKCAHHVVGERVCLPSGSTPLVISRAVGEEPSSSNRSMAVAELKIYCKPSCCWVRG